MILRDADPADADEIALLWNHAVRDTLITFTTEERTAADLARSIAERRPLFLVGVSDGAFAGFATCGPFRAGPGYAATRELTIMLTGPSRGRGLGRALLSALEARAREAGVHVLVAAVSSANPGAVAFFGQAGYAEAGTFREVGRKWDRWLDAVFLQKIL